MLRHVTTFLVLVFAQAVFLLPKVDVTGFRQHEGPMLGINEIPDLSTRVLDYKVNVSLKLPIFKTDTRFLSHNVESAIFNKTNFNFSSTKLQTLMRGLAPAYLRVGGTSSDFVTFQNPCKEEVAKRNHHKQTILCPQDWIRLNDFCLATGLHLVYALNQLKRTEDGQWDPTNTEKLLDFNTYDVPAWELGNEPNSYLSHANISLSGEQIGQDFNVLRTIFNKRSNYRNAVIFGPDINIRGAIVTTIFLERFVAATNATNGTTFHCYYLDGSTATLDDFIDPEVLDVLPGEINLIKSTVDKYYGKEAKPMLGETGSAYNGGAKNLSDRYVAGFMLLDKLGMSAKMGLDVVMRAALYGSDYTMLDLDNLDPKPTYWSAYIYKRLVNTTVLEANVVNTNSSKDDRIVRVYAHCTSTEKSGYDAGAVTLIVMNLHKGHSANITLLQELYGQDVDQYLLTPHGPLGMTSLQIELNNNLLAMVDDRTLPEIKHVRLKGGRQLVLPPLSYGFYVVNNAKAESCIG
ncbi:heparanase-like [Asterias rubens]|uniref:heparanase-like n=1 Tax=Asterias rubens TaxID=7604 RepID=UPI001455662D|nr:heparanase-like [Asterias rubens]